MITFATTSPVKSPFLNSIPDFSSFLANNLSTTNPIPKSPNKDVEDPALTPMLKMALQKVTRDPRNK